MVDNNFIQGQEYQKNCKATSPWYSFVILQLKAERTNILYENYNKDL